MAASQPPLVTLGRGKQARALSTEHADSAPSLAASIDETIAAASTFLNSTDAAANPLASLVASMSKLIAELSQKFVKPVQEDSFEKIERERSAVLIGVPESPKPKPSERRADDLLQVSSILDTLNSEAVPVAVYRMGKKDPDRPRIMKVVFATRHHQREVITSFISMAREQKKHFAHKGVFIRKSLTAAERDADRVLRDALKKERDKGVNCWIFAGKIAYGPPRADAVAADAQPGNLQ